MTLPVALAWSAAWAHAGAGHAGARPPVEPWVAACLVVAGLAYALGVARLWSRARPGRGVARREVVAFAAGLLVLALSLAPPLYTWAASSFASSSRRSLRGSGRGSRS